MIKLEELSRWREIDHLAASLRDKVVIDCGHISVRHAQNKFVFGGIEGPSPTIQHTFNMGLALYRRMKEQGRKAILSLCLSDTSRLLGDGSKRAELLASITAKNWSECLPSCYLEQLSSNDLDDVDITLQTRNSNRFSALIKKMKTRAQRAPFPEQLYREFNIALLSSLDGDRFAISTPFLLDYRKEDFHYGSQAWKSSDYVDREDNLVAAPLTRLKRSGFINLYEKSSGILCPATYGGLLLNYDETYDHICIYSRCDDAYIGEKILRGVIAANVLKTDFSRRCLQIILPELLPSPELSLLESPQIKQTESSFSDFLLLLEEKGIFKNMSFYKTEENVEIS